MSKETRPRAVDDHINDNLKERDPYAFAGPENLGTTDLCEADQEGPASDLFNMNDAALAGRLAYYEGESIFARSQTHRTEAKAEMARTEREIVRRKIAKRNEANKSFAGQAANDLEADHIVEPALAA